MCDKVWQDGEGSKLVQNSVTYFMDGPYYATHSFVPDKVEQRSVETMFRIIWEYAYTACCWIHVAPRNRWIYRRLGALESSSAIFLEIASHPYRLWRRQLKSYSHVCKINLTICWLWTNKTWNFPPCKTYITSSQNETTNQPTDWPTDRRTA